MNPTCQEKASFLTLPVEIRLQIYTYLIPATLIPCTHSNQRKRLHAKKHQFTPSLLYASTQIHNEIIELWYGIPHYGINVTWSSIRLFAGERFLNGVCMHIGEERGFLWPADPTKNPLPQFLHWMTAIQLEICLWHEHKMMVEMWGKYNLLVDALVTNLPKLKRLDLVLQISSAFWWRKVLNVDGDNGRALKESLKYNLDPLRRLNGVEIGWMALKASSRVRWPFLNDGWGSHSFYEYWERTESTIHAYVEEIAGDMVGVGFRERVKVQVMPSELK
jgi:hypothetical protein